MIKIASEIRLLREKEFDQFSIIVANAYPGMKLNSPEAVQRQRERMAKIQAEDPETNYYGLFRGKKLVGGMRLHDFTMQLFKSKVAASGVGGVAVDLAHKKEQVCKELIEFFLRQCRSRSTAWALLYPFRPDFYKQMGFGFGAKYHRYEIPPAMIPAGTTKEGIRHLGPDDSKALLACHDRHMSGCHGMLAKSHGEKANLFASPSSRVVGCVEGEEVTGYLIFEFRLLPNQGFLWHDIEVKEMVYTTANARSQLLAFLHSQKDQVNRVIFNTQDEEFHHLFANPAYGVPQIYHPVSQQVNISSLGVMYRITDIRQAFADLAGHNFAGVSLTMELNIRDSFIADHASRVVVRLERGRAAIVGSADFAVSVAMDIADFSSLLLGACRFRTLFSYGLARLSNDSYADMVDRAFLAAARPVCNTPF